MLKVDLFVAGGTPLDMQQLAPQPVDAGDGVIVHVHPREEICLEAR